MAAGPLCSDTQQQIGAEPLLHGSCPVAGPRRDCWRWWLVEREGAPMRRRLQKSRPSASTAGLQAADETMPNAGFLLLCKATSLYFSPAPPAPLPAPAEAEAARPRHWGATPRQRTAPFGPGSTAPRSASGGRGGHIDFGKRCFWVALPAEVWSRATTEWIEALGAGLTALNGNPNHVDYAATRAIFRCFRCAPDGSWHERRSRPRAEATAVE